MQEPIFVLRTTLYPFREPVCDGRCHSFVGEAVFHLRSSGREPASPVEKLEAKEDRRVSFALKERLLENKLLCGQATLRHPRLWLELKSM